VINTTTYSNYVFTVSVEKIKVNIALRNNDQLTPAPTNGAGYGPNGRTNVVAQFGETLGTPAPNGTEWFNLAELNATITDTNLHEGLHWHRGVKCRRYIWKPAPNYDTNSIAGTWGTKSFLTGATMDEFNAASGGNDSEGGADDEIPDSDAKIFTADAPNLDVGIAIAINAPIGSVAALRFTAREWITWNSGVVSEIETWHSFITIKRTATGWERVGSNEITTGEDTSPFTATEAQGL